MKTTFHQRKKILFGTTVGLSARALLRGQLAWFRERGWEVTLATSPDADARGAVEREKISFLGIPMQRQISPLEDLQALINWIRAIGKVRPYVVNLGTPKASLLGGVAAWLCRVPRRIYTVRGLRLEGTSGFMAKLLWVVERVTIGMATDVIAVSPSLGKEIVDRKLASPKDVWIIGSGSSNGVDAIAVEKRTAQVDKRRLRQQLGIAPSSFVVGYVGRVSESKGVMTLLNALQHELLVDDVELLVIGAIEEAELGKVIAELGDRSHVVPWTDDVWGYFPAIDVLTLPTLREGFPNAVLEAAAAGVPAITTRATGAVDSVIDEETGFLINVGDVDALVDRIKRLKESEELRYSLGIEAKRRVEDQFRPHDIWHGIEAIALGRPGTAQVKPLDQLVTLRAS